ncbi:MAG: Sapep family Mn(2+)-dependent dipeptidase [Oscillospiraceae bacterium]|nr:Sapep family Mn(2+)-dependent dipeptidase [Oscillospiraceae bacterium]
MDEMKVELRQKIDEWFNQHSDEMISDLSALVAINSVRSAPADGQPYGPAAREVLDVVQAQLEKRGFTVENFEDIIITADYGPTADKLPELGILAHLDIVEAGPGWSSDPFELLIKDGKLYGRGTSDDKGPSVAAMYALYCAAELCPKFTRGFRLILGSGEETGCQDIAQYLEKAAPPTYVFTPDAGFPVMNLEKGRLVPVFGAEWEADSTLPRVISISGGATANAVPPLCKAVIEGISLAEAALLCRKYSEKTGAMLTAAPDEFTPENFNPADFSFEGENPTSAPAPNRVVLTSHGKSAHAAHPSAGINAQTALLEMLAAMSFADTAGFRHVQALNRLFPHGDIRGENLGLEMSDKISGELTVNFGVLELTPTGFSANFDSRTPICADEIDIEAITRAAFKREGISVNDLTIYKSHHTPEDTPFVQTLLRIYEDYTGEKGECLAIGGSTYVHDIPGGVAFGCGFPGADNNIHGANEFMELDHLMMSAKMFTEVILEMCV